MLLLLLALATVAAFRNSLAVPFVLDDASSIRSNGSIRQLWPVRAATVGGTRGRPLVNFSFALNYAAGGLNVAGYHATNLAIHLLAGLTLFGLVRRTCLLPVFAGKFSGSARLIAFGAAVLWLLHPLQTETVTYVVQRTESLMGLNYLLTLYCFVRAIEPFVSRRTAWLTLSVVACFAGMACKEVMVTAPLAVLLYDRTFGAGGFIAACRQRPRFYLALASSWIALAWLMSGLGDRGVGFDSGVGPWRYALTESCVLPRYLGLALWPEPLVFDYGSQTAAALAEVWPCALLVVTGVVITCLALRSRPVAGFLLAWPFLTLAPTSSFVPVALQPMAEHRMYLPLAGLVVMAMLGLQRHLRVWAWPVVLVLGSLLGAATYRRNAVYADEISLWRDTVAKRPANDRAHQNLGTAYLAAGRFAEAEFELERALSLNPGAFEALNNLGFVYARTARQARAVELFEQLLKAAPAFGEAHYNLGCVLLELGRVGDAQAHFESAIRVNPDHGNAHINLAAILVQEGKFREAVEHYSAALQVYPDDSQLYSRRAYANAQVGRLSAAIADYEQALKLQPDLADARQNLELLRGVAAPRR